MGFFLCIKWQLTEYLLLGGGGGGGGGVWRVSNLQSTFIQDYLQELLFSNIISSYFQDAYTDVLYVY